MPSREQQCTYLFKTCTDLYPKGLTKSHAVGPERAAAFAAGYVDGMTSVLRQMVEQGAFDAELQQAYALGMEAATTRFSPPPWHVLPHTESALIDSIE